jgi:hypothetical protein
MASTTYTVTTPDGGKHTRTTSTMAYKYAVVAVANAETAAKCADTARKALAARQADLDYGKAHVVPGEEWRGSPVCVTDKYGVRSTLAGLTDRVAEAQAKVDAIGTLANPGTMAGGCLVLGWSQSEAAVGKMADTFAKRWTGWRVCVLPCEVQVKASKAAKGKASKAKGDNVGGGVEPAAEDMTMSNVTVTATTDKATTKGSKLRGMYAARPVTDDTPAQAAAVVHADTAQDDAPAPATVTRRKAGDAPSKADAARAKLAVVKPAAAVAPVDAPVADKAVDAKDDAKAAAQAKLAVPGSKRAKAPKAKADKPAKVAADGDKAKRRSPVKLERNRLPAVGTVLVGKLKGVDLECKVATGPNGAVGIAYKGLWYKSLNAASIAAGVKANGYAFWHVQGQDTYLDPRYNGKGKSAA